MTSDHSSARRRWLRALRRLDRRLQRESVPGPNPRLRWWKRRLLRPFRVVVASWSAANVWGPDVEHATGMSRWRQAGHIAVAGLRGGMPPYVWYRLALFRTDRRVDTEWFLHHGEHDRVLGALAERERDRWAVLDDKRTFGQWASSHGLPANSPIVTATDGLLVPPKPSVAADRLPSDDLVMKAADGGGGRGVEFLLAVADTDPTRWTTVGGEVLDAAAVLDRLVAASADRPQVLERRLRPDPALAGLGVGLCTVRVVTARVGDDEPTVVATVLAIPAEPDGVDNFTAGGLAAPVDMLTGVLLPASTIHTDRAMSTHTHHPMTGHPIAGLELPAWRSVLALAETAHEAAPGVTTVGWDVALTEQGPLLLEANVTWNAEMPQVPGAPPLGRTAWLDVVTEALDIRR